MNFYQTPDQKNNPYEPQFYSSQYDQYSGKIDDPVIGKRATWILKDPDNIIPNTDPYVKTSFTDIDDDIPLMTAKSLSSTTNKFNIPLIY
ncbi:hypothetical protein HZS_3355 [Henneguya salminicola]|nr:hypothetical protein HZS_3355 [Henneguya salminicola]